jgi:hypothetical protein
MTNPTFASSFDDLGGWRAAISQQIAALDRYLSEHDLVDAQAREPLHALTERLGHEKLVVAFVAEFSRGKSELINAIFFADTGRRVLPATPGRTTMCPVELGYEDGAPPALALLPVETRLEPTPLAELRARHSLWHLIELDVSDPQSLSERLAEVTRTQWVSLEQARALGFIDDSRPQDMPAVNEQGQVEVPKWRHALINYPHPLLKKGLVVLDTPGLNAVGTEPELTLSLLPSAHATVFILGADTGVSKSDLTIWRDHLSTHAATRYVVLNKIDALVDPLSTAESVQAQISSQRASTAQILDIPLERVFPLSAREALTGRVQADEALLERSRLLALEAALAEQLLPQRREVLAMAMESSLEAIEREFTHRLSDHRRQLADQLAELRGLRGKSSTKVTMMLRRLQAESDEFEQCVARIQAVRSVHARMTKDMLLNLATDRIREEVERMQAAMAASLLNFGAKKAFAEMCSRLGALLGAADARNAEIRQMLSASFERLNAEFGFALTLPEAPSLERFRADLALIERNYVQYLGITQAFKLGQPRFIEQFRRMLVSKLRVLYETASAELELWNKNAGGQIDSQLRERRKAFRHRRDSLERIQSATGELEQRLAELDSQDQRLQQYGQRVSEMLAKLRVSARSDAVVPPKPPKPPMIKPLSKRVDLAIDEVDHIGEELLTLNLPATNEPTPMLLMHQAPA